MKVEISQGKWTKKELVKKVGSVKRRGGACDTVVTEFKSELVEDVRG